MLRSDLKTLAPRAGSWEKQKLAPIGPVAATALAIATGAAGNVVATWVYQKFVKPRRKDKAGAKKVAYILRQGIKVEITEELLVRTRTRRTKTFRLVSREVKDK